MNSSNPLNNANRARRRWLRALPALTAWPFVGAGAQTNQRTVRLVVPFAAGGSTDAIARLVAQRLASNLGVNVVVDNKPGAGGAIASELVARAPADGNTLLLATTSTHAILPVANPRLGYDPVRDFAPVGLVARAPNVLVTSPALPIKTVAELIAVGRQRRLNFASSGNGTITHLVAEAFVHGAGLQATHVPYKTGVQALTDLVSGQIDFQFDSIVWTLPQVRAGKIRGLAVTGATRSALATELPTVAESGLPGFEGVTWFALVAPAGTAVEWTERLHAELQRVLALPDTQEKLAAQGAEGAAGPAAELMRLMQDDRTRWAKVARDAGVKFE